MSWQEAACLTALLHLYDRSVTCLRAAAGLGVASLAPPYLVHGPGDARCTLLMVVGDDASRMPEEVVVHCLYRARVEPPPGSTQIRLGDRFWVVAPEASLPAQLAESLPSLAAVVPRMATMVRDRRPSAAVAVGDSVPQQ